MTLFGYYSQLTERHILTLVEHGTTWAMPDGEVFDLVSRHDVQADSKGEKCICIEHDSQQPYTIALYPK